MESDAIKACRIQAKKVTQHVLIFVWRKNDVFTDEEKEVITGITSPVLCFAQEITAEFVDNLRISVWIETSRLEYVWGDFIKKHFARITKTPYLFANYFAYASYLLIEKTTDAHSCFHDILSLVTHFALNCWQQRNQIFLNACSELFCAFFDKELCTKLEEQGRWKNFNEYIINQENFKKYRELVDAGKSPYELFKQFAEQPKQTVINGIALEDITEFQVESHKESISFADLIAEKIKNICDKSFCDVLKDFRKTDSQLEELYLEVTGEAPGEKAGGEDQSFSEVPEEASENTCRISDEKIEDRKKQDENSNPLSTQNIDSLQPENRPCGPWKLENVKKAKELLNEMMEDITKISALINYVFEDNGGKDPGSLTG